MPETSGTSKNDVSMFSGPVAIGFALEFADIDSTQKKSACSNFCEIGKIQIFENLKNQNFRKIENLKIIFEILKKKKSENKTMLFHTRHACVPWNGLLQYVSSAALTATVSDAPGRCWAR